MSAQYAADYEPTMNFLPVVTRLQAFFIDVDMSCPA